MSFEDINIKLYYTFIRKVNLCRVFCVALNLYLCNYTILHIIAYNTEERLYNVSNYVFQVTHIV